MDFEVTLERNNLLMAAIPRLIRLMRSLLLSMAKF